jgi:hypothetical protein
MNVYGARNKKAIEKILILIDLVVGINHVGVEFDVPNALGN